MTAKGKGAFTVLDEFSDSDTAKENGNIVTKHSIGKGVHASSHVDDETDEQSVNIALTKHAVGKGIFKRLQESSDDGSVKQNVRERSGEFTQLKQYDFDDYMMN